MGITIKSKNKSFDMGYRSFMTLRCQIAALCPVQEIREHYALLVNLHYMIREPKEQKKYDAETERLFVKCKRNWGFLLDFLYQSDTKGRLTVPQTRKMRKLAASLNPEEKIGYRGRTDCATIQDFLNLLDDATETKTHVRWY